jgi:two-component sensor histidine kinase
MEYPERLYKWIADANITVPEVLLVPLIVGGTPIGTLWIVAREGQQFHSGHERVMTELATFAGVALRMVQSDRRLKQALEEQETLAKEMSHRVKNILAITDSLVRFTSKASQTKEEMTESLSGRLRALSEAHGLVRNSFHPDSRTEGVELSALIIAVLRPYHSPDIDGPTVHLGERTTSNVALIFHELATNAAKYGALSVEQGSVKVTWKIVDDNLELTWEEAGGPQIEPPKRKGFGSTLVENTISSYGGIIQHLWTPHGLVVHIKMPIERLSH